MKIKGLITFRKLFVNGLRHLDLNEHNEAFDCFTNVLHLNDKHFESMERRASIHFLKGEFMECVIECEEIPEDLRKVETQNLLRKAKTKSGLKFFRFQ